MSLQVWLPLTGNLDNKGVSNPTVTNSGATVNSAGKIGSCYSFDGNDDYISITDAKLYSTFKGGTQPFSIAMWVYHGDSTRAILFGDFSLSGGINFNIELTTDHKVRFYWNGNPDHNTGVSVGASTWAHIALTYDGSNLRSYLNGALANTRSGALATLNKTTGAFYLGRDSRTGTTALNGRLNDFRIYNHCLSAAEVREISQGLVLHYKLDSFTGGFGNPNLLKNSRTFGAGWGGTGAITQNAFKGFAVKYKDNSSGTSSSDVSNYNNVLTVNPNEVYTVSFWAKADTAHSVYCFFYNNASGIVQCKNSIASTGATGTSSDGNTTIALTTEWKYYWITWTFNSSGTAALKHIIIGRNPPGQSGISIAMVKLERGSSATPWAPHPDDGEPVAAMVSDSSGYGHNGTINGTLTLSNDTRRYSISSYMPTATTIVHEKPIPNNTDQEWTCSMWVKLDTVGQNNIQLNNFNLGNRIVHSANGHALLYLNGGTDDYYNYGNLAVTANVWTHIAFVFKNSNATKLIYINGVNHTNTGGPNKTSTPAGIPDIVTVGTNLAGYISDYRIYCTALSADDIYELYKVEAKIDKMKEIHTYSFEEQGSRELIAGALWTEGCNQHDNVPLLANKVNGEYVLTGYSSIGSPYIPISPSGHTYVYDIDISTDSGNVFYIGFERYDANKTSRSNNACVYLANMSGQTTARTHQHYHGTVDLSTDGVNPCAFIALRILNDWSSPNNRKATIHRLSLREVSTVQTLTINNNGIFEVDELNENMKAAFHKHGIMEATQFIEM